MTYRELLICLRKRLTETDGELAAQMARLLCAHAAGKTLEQLLCDTELYVPEDTALAAQRYAEEYAAGKPLAYILGSASFYGMEFAVNPSVLIPRDDTMAVTDLALMYANTLPAPRILDLCTGSGCIGLALASRLPNARVTLADVSREALAVAKKNAAAHRLTGRVSILEADALAQPPSALRGYDVLVSNPPYVTAEEMKTLDASVRDYEPHLALCGGADGLDFYRAICRNYARVLKPNGVVCFEFGMGQENAVADILQENDFSELVFRRDSSEIIRAVIARKQGKEQKYGEEETD